MSLDEGSARAAPATGPAYYTCALSKRVALLLILGAILLFPVALAIFITVANRLRPFYYLPAIKFGHGQGPLLVAMVLEAILITLLLSFGLLAFHEYCHGRAFQWAGAKPRYGARMLHKVVPIFYAAAPGFRMSCSQFRTMLLAPTIIVNLAGLLLMVPPTLLRYALILPLAIHLAGCLGDWWMLSVLCGVRGDTLVEDTPQGFRYQR